MDVDGIKTWSA